MSGIQGFTQPLWPIRYKPAPDELLTSWLVRLAHGHGLKVQTLCHRLFGQNLQVWNRDADRLAPDWILDLLAARTGTPLHQAQATTLRVFETILYPSYKASGTLTWVCTTLIYHRLRAGYGMQFCPQCLREDRTPYFRKTWRIALKTFCVVHRALLHDRCGHCDAGVAFYRIDMSGESVPEDGNIARCWHCGADFRESPSLDLPMTDTDGFPWLMACVAAVDAASIGDASKVRRDEVRVLRLMMKLLMSRRTSPKLLEHLGSRLGVQPIVERINARPMIESMATSTRHQLLSMGAWLMADLEGRLGDALRHRALRFNHLLRDFDDPPEWYVTIAERLRP